MTSSDSRGEGAARGRGLARAGQLLVPLARAALLIVPLALAACGSVAAAGGSGSAAVPVTPAPPRSAQPLTLCTDQAAVDHLVVRRVILLRQPGKQHFGFPARVTVASATQARAVARSLCTLPSPVSGIVNCPASFGINYKLRFAAAGAAFPAVTIQATGCQAVTGAGKPRTITRTPAFWTVLAKALGLRSPVRSSAFSGIRA
ncbi:MAG: hypothetical protein ABSA03_13165 [Streptosporangiaceae bacterium]|jgi:hypothetical protein